MNVLIDLAYFIAIVAVSPVVIYKMLRYGRYRAGWANRFGKVARRHPEKKCIWVHCVSVGEVNAARTLIEQLEKKFAACEIVISTTTDTGFERASKLFGDKKTVFYFPMDFSPTMKRAFGNIEPALCLLMELEVWPNLVRIARKSNIPVVVVNGRLSERSFARYKLVKAITRKIFKNLTMVFAQTDEYAERFRALGVPVEKVIVTGSLKYDTAQVADKVEGADELAAQLGLENERLWVAGATGNDEEQIILDVYKGLKHKFSDLRLAIVPRKPERFDEVAELIRQAGFGLIRYSELKKTSSKSKIENVILGDTMGDLRKFYSLATVIFVGRSLVPMGGSDMMEATALGKCTIFGPYALNFKQAVDDLLKANGAILVKDKNELFEAMSRCLTDPDYARPIARNGQEIIRKNQGATARTIAAITQLMTEKRIADNCRRQKTENRGRIS